MIVFQKKTKIIRCSFKSTLMSQYRKQLVSDKQSHKRSLVERVLFSRLSAVQDLNEGLAELDVEGGVDDGVDGAVEVTQPRDGAVERRRDAAAAAVSLQNMSQEERKPADDEDACGAHEHHGERRTTSEQQQQPTQTCSS